MNKVFQISVVTYAGIAYQGEAEYLTVENQDGELGILPEHCPYFTLLYPGKMVIKLRSRIETWIYGDGFLQFTGDNCVVLTEFAENIRDIDPAKAAVMEKEVSEKLAAYRYKTEEEQSELRKAQKIARLELKLAKSQ